MGRHDFHVESRISTAEVNMFTPESAEPSCRPSRLLLWLHAGRHHQRDPRVVVLRRERIDHLTRKRKSPRRTIQPGQKPVVMASTPTQPRPIGGKGDSRHDGKPDASHGNSVQPLARLRNPKRARFQVVPGGTGHDLQPLPSHAWEVDLRSGPPGGIRKAYRGQFGAHGAVEEDARGVAERPGPHHRGHHVLFLPETRQGIQELQFGLNVAPEGGLVHAPGTQGTQKTQTPRPGSAAVLRFLLILAVLSSGCVSINATSETHDPCAVENLQETPPEGCEPAIPPPGKFEKVDIQDAGDLNGVSKTWTWTTEPNATVFDVRVEFAGPAGTGQFVSNGATYLLVGGPTANIRLGEDNRGGGPTSSSLALGTAACVLCYDGRNEMDNYGTWTLTLEAEPSVGTWSVLVRTSYN